MLVGIGAKRGKIMNQSFCKIRVLVSDRLSSSKILICEHCWAGSTRDISGYVSIPG